MSGKHITKNQPSSFTFSEENKEKIKVILKKYLIQMVIIKPF